MGIAGYHEFKKVQRAKPRKPTLDSSSPSPLAGEGRGGGAAGSASRVRKPTLDEMGPGPESKIYQPTSSREAGPEFGPLPRSSGGAPGRRGGWKKK